MAVQKSKVSRSRRGQRRSHDALKSDSLSISSETGEVHRRHHVSKNGFYRGEDLNLKNSDDNNSDNEDS
jgi:large subunit ribosomal protein L32